MVKKILGYGTGALVLIAGILVVLAPIGPVRGFFIGGVETEAPAVWPDTSGIDEVRLRIEDDLPRVVIIWVVQRNNELYVVGANDSGWVSAIGYDSPIDLRIDDSTYQLYATRVIEGQLPILEAYQAKYRQDYPDIVAGMGPPEAMIEGAAVYHLARET